MGEDANVCTVLSFLTHFDTVLVLVNAERRVLRGVPEARAAVQPVAHLRLRRTPHLVHLPLQDVRADEPHVRVPRVLHVQCTGFTVIAFNAVR